MTCFAGTDAFLIKDKGKPISRACSHIKNGFRLIPSPIWGMFLFSAVPQTLTLFNYLLLPFPDQYSERVRVEMGSTATLPAPP